MVKVKAHTFIKCQAILEKPREGSAAVRLPLPSPLGWSMRSAAFLFFSRTLRILSCPSLAARCRTELPQRSRRLRSAPTLSKSSTTSSCLVSTAKCRGVYVEEGQESHRLVGNICSLWLQSHHCSMESYSGSFVTPGLTLNSVRSFLPHMVCMLKGPRQETSMHQSGL